MIPTRVEKLKLIAEEMQLAFYLTKHLTDPFVARTLARHILIRAENFIEHARGLRRPLNDAGYDTRGFHRTKEAYASAFEEYFKVPRHRLGAHVQDFDFGKRIELWNDIEIVKISFFVDGAREIYDALAALNLTSYVAFTESPELADPALLAVLHQFQRAIDSRNWVEMGTDPLALTRHNSAAILNTTPLHARASQLSLIRRWIAMERNLLDKIAAYPGTTRILKARIITDIVSFCDCLVTRPVSPGAPQAMDGLDKLIAAEGQSSAAIDNLVAASTFLAELQTARAIRDSIGAHLEIDDACTVSSVLADLDAYDLAKGLRFYERIAAAFIKTCHSILFLRIYAADGRRLYGVLGANRTAAVPYTADDTATPPMPSAPPPINDEEAYRKNLTRWLDGDDDQKAEARQFFWAAFAGSAVVETIEEVEALGSGARFWRREFRKAHQFLSATLSGGLSDFDFKGILELILSCSRGWPYPLAELLVRHGRNASAFKQQLICHALGELGSAPHASVTKFLKDCSHSPSWPIRLQGALARFKTFVRAEGTYRINHKGQSTADYDAFLGSLMAPMSGAERLICLLAFASILGPGVRSIFQPFQSNYASLQSQIEALCLSFLNDDTKKSKATTLTQLIQTNDYIGVSLLIVLDLDGGDQHPLHAALIDHCCNGSIVAANHDQALRHLAMCFYLKRDHHRALEIAQGLAARNPDWVDAQILVAQILGDTPGEEEKTAKKVADLRHAYKLTPEVEGRLAAVEAEIAKRKSSTA